ncbi:MAG: DUF1957 domain-containing protein [Chthoniobacterales bacterium]|nr:MAG: DUF1957 domain-containing protein [Chthoniobacterales bacterium]
MTGIAKGSLALVLHAHLPFVRHPEQEQCAQERWLFEAITESYVPLLRTMQRLCREHVPFKLTLSVSPTLGSMLSDGLLRRRYLRHLESLIALAERECERSDSGLLPLSRWYRQFFAETQRTFVEEWNCDLLAVIRQLCDDGALELIATAATHAILPILQQTPASARAQIAIGCDFYRDTFGGEPAGFWLPECAYAPGIDRLLQAQNIRWFVVDSHALELARPPARFGAQSPCFTPAGPAGFARDARASRQIWDAKSGYPGDGTYRDFYCDIGFDLTAEELAPLPHAPGQFTGVKYYRVTGGDGAKQFYEPAVAEESARGHAHHFVEQCIATLQNAGGEQPILIAPFDAELFGHWWFEGPVFLEQVARIAAAKGLPLSTPSDFLRSDPPLQIVQPAASSWGDGGFLDTWLDEKCAWIYPQLFAANQRMTALANAHAHHLSREQERILAQLSRELLLAQASDWPFHIRNGTGAEYAGRRVRDHVARFHRLAAMLENGDADLDFLAQCEERDNLLPHLEWRHSAPHDQT